MGKFRGIDADPGWINRRFRELERQIRELRAAKPLAAATIRGAGIIGDGALASPVAPGAASGSTGGQSFGTGTVMLHTENIAVPAGFSQALVFATVSVGATAGAGGVAWQAGCQIDDQGVEAVATQLGADEFGTVTASFTRVLTGLSGSFPVKALAAKFAGDATAGSVNGHVAVMCLFLR